MMLRGTKGISFPLLFFFLHFWLASGNILDGDYGNKEREREVLLVFPPPKIIICCVGNTNPLPNMKITSNKQIPPHLISHLGISPCKEF